jgi:hypothetical protein
MCIPSAAAPPPRSDSARISAPAAASVGDGRLRPRGGHSPTTATAGAPGPMQGLLAVLEHAWAAIRAHHAEIPPVIMLIGSGSDRGGVLRKLGHFAARRWRLADGAERSEILLAGEGLDRSPELVLATLLHEAAHALAFARGIRDTSNAGRYHNRRFAAVAIELGLQVAPLRPLRPGGDHHAPRHRRPLRRRAAPSGRRHGAVAGGGAAARPSWEPSRRVVGAVPLRLPAPAAPSAGDRLGASRGLRRLRGAVCARDRKVMPSGG